MFDTDGDGSIDMKELVNGLQILTKGSETEKLKFLFNVYDLDGEFQLIFYGGGGGSVYSYILVLL